MVKKSKTKQRQKQKQSQKVIVNVGTGSRKQSAKPRPPPRLSAPNFPIGPRSDPFIPREYKQPSLTDILNIVQSVKQPVSQSIEKKTEKETSFAPRSISSVLSKASGGATDDLTFIGQDPSIITDVAKKIGPSFTGALGGTYVGFGLCGPFGAVAGSVAGAALGSRFFGTEPNPTALQPVVPPPSQPSALERKRPSENPFTFVDKSPVLSTLSPSENPRPTRNNFNSTKPSSLIPETETFVDYRGPLFVNPFATSRLVPDYGIIPETTTFLTQSEITDYQPDADIFVDAEDEEYPDLNEPIQVEPISITEGPTTELPPGPLPPQRRVESSDLTQQAEIPPLFVPSYSDDEDAPFSPASLERFKQEEEALLKELADPELGERPKIKPRIRLSETEFLQSGTP